MGKQNIEIMPSRVEAEKQEIEKLTPKKLEEMQIRDIEGMKRFAEEYEKVKKEEETPGIIEKKEKFFAKVEQDFSLLWMRLAQEKAISKDENEIGLVHGLMKLEQDGKLSAYESELFKLVRDEFLLTNRTDKLKQEWDQRNLFAEIKKNIGEYEAMANDPKVQKAVQDAIEGKTSRGKKKPEGMVDWIKQNPGKTAMIVGGGALALYSIGKILDKAEDALSSGGKGGGWFKKTFGVLFTLGAGGMIYKNREEFFKMLKKASGFDIKKWMGLDKNEKFGLDKEKYNEALTLWKQGKTDDVEKIFEGDKENFEEFRKEREEKEKIEEVDGVKMTSPEVALGNYKMELGMMIDEMGEWVKDHWAEMALGGYLLHKIGALQAAWRAGENVFGVAKDMGRTLLSFGINHPFASLLMFSGGIGTGLGAYELLNKNQKIPASLSEIGGWIETKEDQALDMIEKVAPGLHIDRLRGFKFDKLKVEFGKFLNELPTKMVDAIRTDEERSIRANEANGLDKLILALQEKRTQKVLELRTSVMDAEERNRKTAEVYAFYDNNLIVQIQDMIGKLMMKPEYKIDSGELAKLKKIVENEGGELVDNGLKVSWRMDKNDNNWLDLCVSPQVEDLSTRYDIARRLEMNQGTLTSMAEIAGSDARIEFTNAADVVDKVRKGEYGLAVVDGGMFVIKNGVAAFWGPVNTIKKAGLSMLEGDLNWEGAAIEYSDAVVPVAITGASIEAVQAVMGVYTRGGEGTLSALHSVPTRIWRLNTLTKPLTMPWDMVVEGKRMYDEVRIVRAMGHEGRELNVILKKAGVSLQEALDAKNGKMGRIRGWRSGLGNDYIKTISDKSKASETKINELLNTVEGELKKGKQVGKANKVAKVAQVADKADDVIEVKQASFLKNVNKVEEAKPSRLSKLVNRGKEILKGKEAIKGTMSMTADKWYLLSRTKDTAKIAAELEKVIPQEALAEGMNYLQMAEKVKGAKGPQVLVECMKEGKALQVGKLSFLSKAGVALAILGTAVELYNLVDLLDEYSNDTNNETAKIRLENLGVHAFFFAANTTVAVSGLPWVTSGALAAVGAAALPIAVSLGTVSYMYDKANSSRIEIRKTAEDWGKEYTGREEELYHELMGTSGTRAGDAYAAAFTWDTIEDYANEKKHTREKIVQNLAKYNLEKAGFDAEDNLAYAMQIARQEMTGLYAVSSQGEVRETMEYITDFIAVWKASGKPWNEFFEDSPRANHEKVNKYLKDNLGIDKDEEVQEKAKKAPNESLYVLGRMAEEFGYEGEYALAPLRAFFDEEHAGERGVYYDEGSWRVNKEGWDWDTEVGRFSEIDLNKMRDIFAKEYDNIFESRYDSITEFSADNLALQRQAQHIAGLISRARAEYSMK